MSDTTKGGAQKTRKTAASQRAVLSKLEELLNLIKECCENMKNVFSKQQEDNKELHKKLDDIMANQSAVTHSVQQNQEVYSRKEIEFHNKKTSLPWYLWLLLALFFFLLLYKFQGCEHVGCNTVKPCKVYTKVAPVDLHFVLATSIVEKRSVKAFRLNDGEISKDTSLLAIAEDYNGTALWENINKMYEHEDKQVELVVSDQPDHCGNYFVKDFKEYIPKSLETKSDTVFLPAPCPAAEDTLKPKPAPGKGNGKRKAEAKLVEVGLDVIENDADRSIRGIILKPVANAKEQLADKNNFKTNVTFGETGDVLHVVNTSEVVVDIPNGTYVPRLHLTRADSLAKGMY